MTLLAVALLTICESLAVAAHQGGGGAPAAAAVPFHPGRRVLSKLPRKLRRRLRHSRLMGTDYSPSTDASTGDMDGGLRVTPAQYGGDPTGRIDSTAALQKALGFCINATRFTPGTFSDLAGDAGGCTVDLAGGEYTISTTLVIPTYVSNLRIATGSLRANPATWQREAPAAAADHGRTHDAATCDAASFPVDLSGKECMGLSMGPPGSHGSEQACLAACCAAEATCGAYQFCAPDEPCAQWIPRKTMGCWLAPVKPFSSGAHCAAGGPGSNKTVGWVGGAYTPPPPPPWAGTFLIKVGGTETCVSPNQGSCNEDIGFPGLFLDGSHMAGGISINQVMGTTVGPQSYLLNFSGYGILVNGGHEVMIVETWLGQTNFDYNYSMPGAMKPSATAIAINSNDHYIQDSIVFSSLVGLHVAGAANMITGLHVWFPLNAATSFSATAFLDTGHQNRYDGCYVDCSHAYFVNPSNLIWTDAEILGGGIVIQGAAVSDLRIVNNNFNGGAVSYEAANGIVPNVTGTTIDENIGGRKLPSPGTRATMVITSAIPLSNWAFDFCDRLVFGNIVSVVSTAFTTGADAASSSAHPAVVARRPTAGCRLVVAMEPATAGTLVVSVDESAPQL